MLIQGTNIPIKITLDADVNSYRDLVATLWIQNKKVKEWRMKNNEIEADGTTAILALDEDETRKFKKGKAKLLVKGLNFFNEIVFWEEATIEVIGREDYEVDLID